MYVRADHLHWSCMSLQERPPMDVTKHTNCLLQIRCVGSAAHSNWPQQIESDVVIQSLPGVRLKMGTGSYRQGPREWCAGPAVSAFVVSSPRPCPWPHYLSLRSWAMALHGHCDCEERLPPIQSASPDGGRATQGECEVALSPWGLQGAG
ncbi:hypothetical protein NDU88_003353 [Pleurodeles waltl]|uniref:Uncharacterized protein n=1 Tax=Pleurodeles waltl TaxID=8319 RepID=A0AAV7UFX2_PLEWA|nr:hypothetical protein NDU88_003353 [Pleurodeles waltl]